MRNSYVTVTRVPTVDRIKTAKVTFAMATPYRSLIVTDRSRVPAPTVSKIALGVPPRKVRGVTMMFRVRERAGQRPADQNYCDDADDWTCDHLQAFISQALLLPHSKCHYVFYGVGKAVAPDWLGQHWSAGHL